MFDLSRNYFELFGIPVGFRLDVGELSSRYRELQKVVHPDRYAAAGDRSQRLALQGATLVNEAFETLKNPLQRGKYLLSLHGVDVDSSQQTLNDPAFLMQQMELRETLAELGSGKDPHGELDQLLRQIDGMLKSETAALAVQFEDPGAEQMAAAVQSIQKMQFLHKLRAEAEAVEADLAEIH